MWEGCSPLPSSQMLVPMQVSPWPGCGLCPGTSTASGCTGRHRRPWPLPMWWSGSRCPGRPATAALAGRWSETGPPQRPSSRVNRGLPGVPVLLVTALGGYQEAGSPPNCPSTKPCPKPSPHPPWTHTQGRGVGAGQPEPRTPVPALLSIADGIEPFQRYNITVYPLYKDAVGVPVHTVTYSKQKGTSGASSRLRVLGVPHTARHRCRGCAQELSPPGCILAHP